MSGDSPRYWYSLLAVLFLDGDAPRQWCSPRSVVPPCGTALPSLLALWDLYLAVLSTLPVA